MFRKNETHALKAWELARLCSHFAKIKYGDFLLITLSFTEVSTIISKGKIKLF